MEILSYQLRIEVEEKFYEIVSDIIKAQPKDYKYGWSYDIILDEEKEPYDVIMKFLDLLEGKYERLFEFGIKRNNITIWLIYGYNNQCNMEFSPNTLQRLGENGIKLCISCYEAGHE